MASLASLTALHLPGFAEKDRLPEYADEPIFLRPPAKVFEALGKVEWAFDDAETGFLAHDIHPYPAKFIPQIPGTLISSLCCRGELVLDPFGGSGTTALEAIRLGRRAVSVDANPLSALIGRAKTAWVDRSSTLELHGFHAALAAELQVLPAEPRQLIALHSKSAPEIPNRHKWFADSAFAELCLVKTRVAELETAAARDVALVALSRIAIKSSFQDSETRYKSVVREVPVGETLRRYLRELRSVTKTLTEGDSGTRYGMSKFIEGDIRSLKANEIPDGSVDLIVTSPPYGNATDYHLYHRFRLLWLGFDPVALGKIEIGSHLRHQREGSGFSSYFEDLAKAVSTMERVLRPERYVALVIGDSVYEGSNYDPATRLAEEAGTFGFDACCVFKRPVHMTKRSFSHAGRRATSESIVVMRKHKGSRKIFLRSPPYKLWPYERFLRLREAGLPVTKTTEATADEQLITLGGPAELMRASRLTFTHAVSGEGIHPEPTWQAALENGGAHVAALRKDPKYATHGLHPYKGKFYPQLAKGLINLSGIKQGDVVLDPFCGSGTTLLEGYLNGMKAYGCDLHPLAAKIAKAKAEILECDPDVLTETVGTVLEVVENARQRTKASLPNLTEAARAEMQRWFAEPVIEKIAWLLKIIRKNSAGSAQDFLEVVLSSIIREVSQQEPSDLRIRYRRELLDDADVVGLFASQLRLQYARVEKFWRVKGRAPWVFQRTSVVCGDNRAAQTYEKLGVSDGMVDLVLTSPPYATALPYIDTDRLSLLTLFGLGSAERKPIENNLIGSREITPSARKAHDAIQANEIDLPTGVVSFLNDLRHAVGNDRSAGFRKQNMPALMTRYLSDMKATLSNAYRLCRSGAQTMIVIGDNRMEISGTTFPIPTTSLVESVACDVGFSKEARIDISVTTENLIHQKNAITKNVVLHLVRP